MSRLSKVELLEKVLIGFQSGGWLPLIIDRSHPFLIRASHPEGRSVDLRIYIWNCTHGGGGRSDSEFRVQFTTFPQRDADCKTLLLGWHDEHEVFAAWDIDKHDGQAGSSPSAQIREDTLLEARESDLSVQVKENEIVVAFRPVVLIDYALASKQLHSDGRAHRDMALLNQMDTLTDEQIEAVTSAGRREIIRTITVKHRARKFRGSVLTAYRHRCAFCSVQLSLLDAAHIVPVSAPGSSDEVANGVALCKLHHFAYDANLVSFDVGYRIAVSRARVAELRVKGLQGGLEEFKAGLHEQINVPAIAAHRPSRANIARSRRVRGWRP
jgi:putative restriction endonuclease